MRLSEISGERVFDVIADIIDPACSIAMDPKAAELFNAKGRPEGMEAGEYLLVRVRRALPVLIRDHRDDLIAIMASIEGVGADEYRENVTIPALVKSIYDMLTDEDLFAFLSSSDKTRTQGGERGLT